MATLNNWWENTAFPGSIAPIPNTFKSQSSESSKKAWNFQTKGNSSDFREDALTTLPRCNIFNYVCLLQNLFTKNPYTAMSFFMPIIYVR